MKSVSWFVPFPHFTFSFQETRRFPQARVGWTFTWVVALLILLNGALLTEAQSAHFVGAQMPPVSGTSTTTGTDIISIAVDAAGDVIFTAQNPSGGMASRSQGVARYIPAAFHPASRRLSDGRHSVDAQKLNASTCTYSGSGSMLFIKLASTGTVYMVSDLAAPMGVALDSAGDLYVLDAITGAIYKYLGANGNVQVQSTYGASVTLAGPHMVAQPQNACGGGDMAADAHGNLYYTTSIGNAVEEILAVNGVIPASPTIQSLGSGFNFPTGIAVDGNGNVYVADSLNNAVKEIVAVNGSIPVSPTILRLGSGYNVPAGVAVDKQGDVYVSDFNNNALEEILAVNGQIPSSPAIDRLGTYQQAQAVTLDASGDIFVGYAGNAGGTVAELAAGGANFGEANVGSAAPAIPMQFSFDTSGTLAGISVLTQGASGLDFADAGSGTCSANTTYFAGQSCTVNVNFTARLSGTRNGAVVLTAANGNVIATGYLQGAGVGSQVSFTPPTESGIPVAGNSAPLAVAIDGAGNLYVAGSSSDCSNDSCWWLVKETFLNGAYTEAAITSGLSDPQAVAVDGAGNVYVADMGNSRVLKETPTATGYAESTVDSGFGYPYGVAVDGSGNVYIADAGTGRILKETLSPGGYTRSTAVSGLTIEVSGVAVDGSGNLYVADGNNGYGLLLKETLLNGAYTQSTIPVAGQIAPQSIAVDGTGNVYFEDAATDNIYKETSTPNGYVESTVIGDLHIPSGPWGVAVDANGNVYTGYPALHEVVKADFADAPSLSFANTSVGSTSADSPRTVTLQNSGTAALIFPISTAGNNPSIGPDFTLSSSGESDCPVLNSGSSSPATLAPGAICELTVSFAPGATGSLSEPLTLTDNSLNAAYATQTITLTGVAANQTTPLITWPTPAAISFGTPLGAAQLDASANVQGTFSYAPAAGTVLGAGTQTITVTFTPADPRDYTTATATVAVTVNQVMPVITWSAPTAITYGTALGSTQLNATSTVAGTFSYSPAPGTVLTAGQHTITATFTPADTADYTTTTSTVTLTVNQANPAIIWNAPTAVTYGTALSAAQLNASSTVAGTFSYSPAAGTVLTAGQNAITATFTPTDTADYTKATTTVTLTVNKATPAISWNPPAAVSYGTALGSAQLDATANVQGSFSYSPGMGAVLSAGTQTLTATFTPTDSTDYATATANVALTVNKATPAVTWPVPGTIAYGTPLSSAQLDATTGVGGSFTYSPSAGAVLGAGTQTLSVTFAPTDTADYSAVTTTVSLVVNRATPAINWPTPASIPVGTTLSATQLNATATVPGTFVYSPMAGTVPAAGSQNLTTVFTPTDSADYNTATASVVLEVTAPPTFTLSTSSGSLTVGQGKTGPDTVTVIGQNGFNSSVTLSASGLPAGVTASFGTNPTTGSSILTFLASTSATPGTYAVTLKGVSGSLSASTTISLTIQAGFACHVGYSITNSWPGGFQVALNISNTGATAISNWTLTWIFANGQKVTQFWNGNESQSGANVTVQNMSYNGSIAPGTAYTGAGFNGSWNNQANSVPTSFAINGTTCQ